MPNEKTVEYHEQRILRLQITRDNLQNAINRVNRSIDVHQHNIEEINAGGL